jgi:hypothetical protein
MILLLNEAKVLFDFSNSAPRSFTCSVLFVSFLIVAEIAFFYLNPEYRAKSIGVGRKTPVIFIAGWISFAIVAATISGSHQYFKFRDIYTHQTYKIAEGRVKNWREIKVKSSFDEQFEVNGVSFTLIGTDDDFTFDKLHVVQNDMPLKIFYCREYGRNVILHFEIEPS